MRDVQELTLTFSSIFLAGWGGGGGASGSKLTRCPMPRRKPPLAPEFQPLAMSVSILKGRSAQSSSVAPISSPGPLSPGDLAPLAPCSSSSCALSETDRSIYPFETRLQSAPVGDTTERSFILRYVKNEFLSNLITIRSFKFFHFFFFLFLPLVVVIFAGSPDRPRENTRDLSFISIADVLFDSME